MVHKSKRTISALLVVFMMISVMPVSAFADDDDDVPWWERLKDAAEDAIDSADNVASDAKDTVVSTASDVKNTVVDAAVDAKDAIVSSASNAYISAKNYISSISLPDFKKGWEMASSFFGTTAASVMGEQYVKRVAASINTMQGQVVNSVKSGGSTISHKAGYAAEAWHAGTYNIDAVAKDVKNTATQWKSNGMGSVDVSVGDDLDASMKYYKTVAGSAKAQAKNYIQEYKQYASKTSDPMSLDEWLADNGVKDKDLLWSIYKDQIRVIPSDQLDDAKEFLEKAIAKESAKDGPNRPAVKADYEETLKNLSDRIETADGTSSIPLSKEEAEALAKAGVDNDLDLAAFGVTTASAINGSYIAKQALKGGASAAIIEAAVTMGPQLYEIIKYLIVTGEVDEEQLKETGFDGLTAAADGFLKGSISNALVIMCQAGKFGAEYMSASPELIGAMTVLVIDAIRFGIKMANGEMAQEDYIDMMAQEFLVSAFSLGSAALVALLFPQASLAICLGSFVGGLVASAGYSAGKEFILAKISESDVDLLVPIESTAQAIKGKVSITTTKLKDVLSDIKGIKKNSIKDITIKVFDFTEL